MNGPRSFGAVTGNRPPEDRMVPILRGPDCLFRYCFTYCFTSTGTPLTSTLSSTRMVMKGTPSMMRVCT